jgi:hypothetical protein
LGAGWGWKGEEVGTGKEGGFLAVWNELKDIVVKVAWP